MFSEYCSPKYSYEKVEIIRTANNNKKDIQPKLQNRTVYFNLNKANMTAGIDEPEENVIKLLSKMGLTATPNPNQNKSKLVVSVPPSRHDILHERDIVEDLAIAYGYNNIKKTFPKTATVAQEFPLNKLSDQLRDEISRSGFTEALTFALVIFLNFLP